MKLRLRGPRRLPFVAQLTASECAVACLSMVLAYHGHPVARPELRRALGTGRDGASAHALFQAARTFGLRGRALRLRAAELPGLARGSILHWEGKHFVVLARASRRRAWILDPASGRRRLALAEVERSFSGLALELEPDPERWPAGERSQALPSPTLALLRAAGLRARLVASLVLAAAAAIGVGLGVAATMQAVVARALEPAPRFADLGLAIAGLVLATVGAHRLRGWSQHALGRALDAALGRALIERLLALPWAFHRLRASEDLADRIASVGRLRAWIVRAAAIVAIDAPMLAAYLAVVSAWGSAMGWIAVVLAVAHRAVGAPLRARRSLADASEASSEARVEGFVARALQGMHAIKALGSEARVAERWAALRDEAEAHAQRRERAVAASHGLVEGFGLLIPLVLLAVGAHEVFAGALSIPALFGAHWLAVALLRPLGSILDGLELASPIRRAVERLDDVLAEALAEARGGPEVALALPAAIELEAVTVAAAGGDAAVLEIPRATLPPVRHVAIVGRSGSGKSTLAALLVGLVRPDRGRVSLGGHELAAHGIGPGPRHGLALVVPPVPLFNGSVRDAIALGADHPTTADVAAAARTAGLDELVASLPLGYDTSIFDGGKGLPDGLKHRIAIARALVGRPALLVLDEAAAALGEAAEAELVEAILRGPVRTLVTVSSHRGTVERADAVVVLERGRIVDVGSPALLLGRCAEYRRLFPGRRAVAS